MRIKRKDMPNLNRHHCKCDLINAEKGEECKGRVLSHGVKWLDYKLASEIRPAHHENSEAETFKLSF